MKEYNVVEYWNERDNPCSNTIDKLTNAHTNYLKQHVKGCKYVMDFGSGYGRLFSIYENGTNVTGVDVTEQYLVDLMENSLKNGINFSFLHKPDIMSEFHFPDKFFDAVVASEVLFHQTPTTVEFMMKELLRVSKKVIVITYMNKKEKYDKLKGNFDKSRYCFNYNYYNIMKKYKWYISNEERVRNQIMFVYKDSYSFNYDENEINFVFDNKDFYMSKLITSKQTFYELPYLEYLRDNKIIKSNDTIVEVGAYLGNHTIYFSKIIGCKYIHSFEPTEESFKVLQKNIQLNNMANVSLYNYPVASKIAHMNVTERDTNNPGANQYNFSDKGIETVTIDSMNFENVNFIKIDAEGMEVDVLKGAIETIKKFKPIIMIEIEKNNRKKLNSWIKENNYKRIYLDKFNKDLWLLGKDE